MTEHRASTPTGRFPGPAREFLSAAETWVFDLDNTLYPASTNLFAQIDVRMREYISGLLDVGEDEAFRLQKEYFREFGTTLRGLMNRHEVDPGPYLEFVHDIDLTPLAPSPTLEAALARLPGRKIIFTNATTKHAERVTARLGVDHHFEAVYDIAGADYVPKPAPSVYAKLLDDYQVDPGRAVMFEDMARNLAPAADLGMATVWVRTGSDWGAEGADGGHVHHVTDDLVGWLEAVVADTR